MRFPLCQTLSFCFSLIICNPGVADPLSDAIWRLSFQRGLATPLAVLQANLRTAFRNQSSAGALQVLGPVGESPLQYIEQFRQAQPPLLNTTNPQQALRDASDYYAQQFSGEDQTCQLQVLPPPQSLTMARDQIINLGAQVKARFDEQLPASTLESFSQLQDPVLQQLEMQPWGGEMESAQQKKLAQFLALLAGVDKHSLLCASRQWAQLTDPAWMGQLEQLMSKHPRADEAVIARFEVPGGQIVFAGRAASTLLADDVVFLADLGGDDLYGLGRPRLINTQPQLLVDFAGNDRYESANAAAFAAGIGGTSLLIDLQGNDYYKVSSFGLGVGLAGVGMLMDASGDDQYLAQSFAQGYGLHGVGLLLDSTGQDQYSLGALGQGLGMPAGLGALQDVSGADHYVAGGLIPTNYGTPGLSDAWAQGVGLGLRGFAPGGLGWLRDNGGNDRFDAGSFAQGGGYYFGFGMLIKQGAGADDYLGTRYSLGWGAHGGLGWFRDEAGADYYHTRHLVAAGLAWDHSLALFEDGGGDDRYELGDFSLGAAAIRSVAVFHDESGQDTYSGARPADADDNPPNMAVFIDSDLQPEELTRDMAIPACILEPGLSLILPDIPDDQSFQQHCRH